MVGIGLGLMLAGKVTGKVNRSVPVLLTLPRHDDLRSWDEVEVE